MVRLLYSSLTSVRTNGEPERGHSTVGSAVFEIVVSIESVLSVVSRSLLPNKPHASRGAIRRAGLTRCHRRRFKRIARYKVRPGRATHQAFTRHLAESAVKADSILQCLAELSAFPPYPQFLFLKQHRAALIRLRCIPAIRRFACPVFDEGRASWLIAPPIEAVN